MEYTKEQLQEIFQYVPGISAMYLAEEGKMRFLFYSPTAPAFSGLSEAELLDRYGQDAMGLVFEADRPALEEALNKLLQAGEYSCTFRSRHKMKPYVWAHADAKLVGTLGGRPVILCAFTDMSGSFTSNTPGGIFVYSAAEDEQFIYVSQPMLVMLGYTHEEFVRKFDNRFSLMVYQSDRERVLREISEQISKDGDYDTCEYRIEKKDGSLIWVHDDGHYVVDENGRHWFYVIDTDITGSITEKELLIEKSGELDRIVNNVPAGVIVYQYKDGMISYVSSNSKVPEILGIDAGCLRSGDQSIFTERIHPGDRKAVVESIRHILSPGAEKLLTFRFRAAGDGYKWLRSEVNTVALPDGSIQNFAVISDITEEKEAEQALLRSQQRYRIAVEGAGLSVWEYRIGSRRLTGSGPVFRKFSRPAVFEDVPQSLFPYLSDAEREKVSGIFRRLDNGETRVEEDLWVRWNETAPLCCEHLVCSAAEDENGGAPVAYGISIDVTAQKKASEIYENELSALRSANTVNLIAKGHHDLTQNRVIEYVPIGDRACELPAGTSYDEACRLLARIPELRPDREALTALIDRENLIRACREGRTHFSYQYMRSKGEQGIRWVTTVINTYQVPSTGAVECFTYSYDTTQDILKGHVLEKLPDLGFQEIGLIHLASGICTACRTGSIEDDSSSESTGDYAAELRDCADRFFLPAQREEAFEALSLGTVAERLRRDGAYSYTVSLCLESGIHRDQIRFSWLDAGGQTVFYCHSDITQEFEKEQQQIRQLSAAKMEAEQANDAKSTFLSSMSHDLRTPLNGIIGFTEIALKEPDPEKKQDYLKKIKASGNILIDLVNDTLELSRIESGKVAPEMEEFSAKACIRSIADALRSAAEQKGIRLITVLPRGDDVLLTDRLKLQKIILNILSNAVRYTPAGGTVTLSESSMDPPLGGCNRRIVVEDTGIGIGAEFLPRAFEPFAQEKRPGPGSPGGTGLGLTIVKRYVDLLGGTVHIDSTVGKGTRVEIDLPVRVAAAGTAGADRSAPCADLSVLAGKRILLCEDNAINTEIATTLLKEKGMLVESAANGMDGLNRFVRSAPGFFDAVLMDIRMPVMNGYETAVRIRSLDRTDAKSVPILAMTADAFAEDVRHSLDSGMNGHISKPIDPENLYRTLGRLIGGR